MLLTEPLTLSTLIISRKTVFFRILSAHSRQKKWLAMTNARNVVYIGLENIESNGVSDWFRKREHAIGCALTCAASKKTSLHRQILSGDKARVQLSHWRHIPVCLDAGPKPG